MPRYMTHGTGVWKLHDDPVVADGQEGIIRKCATTEDVLRLKLDGVRLYETIGGKDITPVDAPHDPKKDAKKPAAHQPAHVTHTTHTTQAHPTHTTHPDKIQPHEPGQEHPHA